MKGLWHQYIAMSETKKAFSSDVNDDYGVISPVMIIVVCFALVISVSGCAVSDVETSLRPDEASIQEQDHVLPNEHTKTDFPTEGQTRTLSFEKEPVVPPKQTSTQQFADLPNDVQSRILQAIATDLDISEEEVFIESVSAQSWPDGCLGLANPDEFCTMAVVNGWKVVASRSEKHSVAYRSDANGLAVRREN